MKGIVFTEFLSMVEQQFGLVVADKIVSSSNLTSGGAYTAVGTYEHGEMVQLLGHLSKEIDTPVETLLLVYGEYFFQVLVDSYPAFIKNIPSAFAFLSSIENHIHVEVLKLYPDAELPSFDISQPHENTLEMIYHSERKMASFARGLLNSCVIYFNEEIEINSEDISGDGKVVKFTLVKS